MTNRVWHYNEPVWDEHGNIIDNKVVEVTDEDIIRDYWPWWSEKMAKKYGEGSPRIKKEDCIDDYVVVNWAWEKRCE